MTVGHGLVSSILWYPIPCPGERGLRITEPGMYGSVLSAWCMYSVWMMDASPTPGASTRRDGDLPLLAAGRYVDVAIKNQNRGA